MLLKDLIEQYGEYEVIDTVDTEIHKGNVKNEGTKIYLRKPKPKSVWDLEKGDTYFLVYYNGLTYTCDTLTWKDMDYEKAQRETGILFLTKEEAEQDLERRKVETLLLKYGGRRWFKKDGENWHIESMCADNVFIKYYAMCYLGQGAIYFDTCELAQKAIEQIGEERIKKALIEVR